MNLFENTQNTDECIMEHSYKRVYVDKNTCKIIYNYLNINIFDNFKDEILNIFYYFDYLDHKYLFKFLMSANDIININNEYVLYQEEYNMLMKFPNEMMLHKLSRKFLQLYLTRMNII